MEGSVGKFKVVGAHLSLQQVGLTDHPVDVQSHNAL
jgi:hypothetical protein